MMLEYFKNHNTYICIINLCFKSYSIPYMVKDFSKERNNNYIKSCNLINTQNMTAPPI